MRQIIKLNEPSSLTKLRCTPDSNYGQLKESQKDELRKNLVTEQRGLCCFCMQRIRPVASEMKIAHWQPQTSFPMRQLEYSNLLGACRGNEGQPRRDQHCDTHQEDAELKFNPADPAHQIEHRISFSTNGEIRSNDAEFDKQLENVLNLNISFLRTNRKAVLDGFKASLPKGELKRPQIEAMISKWSGESHDGILEPFAQVVVYWLRRKLNSKLTAK